MAIVALLVATSSVVMLSCASLADEPKKDWSLAFNIGATTDYVFRGVSQTAEKPSIQGGADFTYKMFYAGVWLASVDFVGNSPGPGVGIVEVDYYAGVKFPVGKMIEVDLGGIYYTYPGANDKFAVTGFKELDYFEFKAGAKYKPIDPLTIGTFVFFTPEGTNKTGQVWTFEGSVEYVFPKFHVVTPSISALIGYQTGEDARYNLVTANGRDNYTYWNAGLTLGVGDNLSFDVRYWDTNIANNSSTAKNFCTGAALQCDERVVGTVKVTF
jgi:uncharacterized protein (TIGR02001 family)